MKQSKVTGNFAEQVKTLKAKQGGIFASAKAYAKHVRDIMVRGEQASVLIGAATTSLYEAYCKARLCGQTRVEAQAPFREDGKNWDINFLSDNGADYGQSIGKYESSIHLAIANALPVMDENGDVITYTALRVLVQPYRKAQPRGTKKRAESAGSAAAPASAAPTAQPLLETDVIAALFVKLHSDDALLGAYADQLVALGKKAESYIKARALTNVAPTAPTAKAAAKGKANGKRKATAK